ncbi:MAG: hypothetical protein KC488_04185, partial [Candidatus Cloacimonetes bacterium]|nr:hypothetical protein [Candidatus Cloacimonadota bacterium]
PGARKRWGGIQSRRFEMYLHECYLVPKGTLDAIVKHLEDQPYKTAAPLLTALNNLPNCAAESVQKAGLEMHPEDTGGWVKMAEAVEMRKDKAGKGDKPTAS